MPPALLRHQAGQALEQLASKNDSWYSTDAVKTYSTMIGNKEKESSSVNGIPSFSDILVSLISKGKFKKLMKEKSRTYAEILEGKPAYSEVVQSYWITNSNDLDKIVLYDTQVKYGKSYRYLIYAYVMVIGTEYKYSSLTFEKTVLLDPLRADLPLPPFVANCVVTTEPKLRIMQIPYYGFSNAENSDLFIYDNPPPAPDISFYPIRGSKSKLKIFLNGNVDRYDKTPIFIEDSDEGMYDNIRKAQKKSPQEKITFEADDASSAFQVFRISPDPQTGLTKRPRSYKDFKNELLLTVNESNPSPAGAMIDTLIPNQKYYYCFRTIDIHNNVSPPSEVYEVEIQSQSGTNLGYPVIRPYDMNDGSLKVATKPFKRHLHLRAPLSQIFIPQNDGENNTTAIDKKVGRVGVSDDAIFGAENTSATNIKTKKFKIRLTSRQTGRKIDVNVRFVHKQTE